ncbi:hypothetical protein MBLNU230_g3593t1 [Neophaeotheca triangularis]
MSPTFAQMVQEADFLSTRIPQARSRDEALENAIKAAELSMQALKLATNPTQKQQQSTRVSKLLAEAERIKHSDEWRLSSTHENNEDSLSATVRELKEPLSSRELSKAEQIIIYKASYLNRFTFPPWTKPPDPSEFELEESGELYTDDAIFHLSDFQAQVFDGFKRPKDALPPPAWFPANDDALGPSMSAVRSVDVVQDAATDCSVVASLCAGIARGMRGHAKLLRSVLWPYDAENKRPKMSKNGKYIVRLNFNGTYRRVVIDDTLPTSKTSRVLHVVDRHNPGLLWPALIEKAYLKVRGGYDFPGSNSGTDLWILSGWIPEQVFLRDDDVEPDHLWKRLMRAFTYGDVLITMGTGRMSQWAEKQLGLAGEHDYAVLDICEEGGQRLMLIKNPWCEGANWRGKLPEPRERKNTQLTPEDIDQLALDDDEPVQSSRDLLNADDQLSPGTFWMDLDNIIQHFDSIYLNWNPGLFTYRQDIHFAWDFTPSAIREDGPVGRGRFSSLRSHPQFSVATKEGGTVWLLLCRHFQNVVPSSGTAAQRQEIDLEGFISLHAFNAQGRRVLLAANGLKRGPYVDSPQTLLKLDSTHPSTPYTIVPDEEDLPPTRHTFTLSAFSTSPITLQTPTTRFPFTRLIPAAWTKETAGGNAHSPTYSTNPQFALHTPQPTHLSLLLEATSTTLNVHVKLVHGHGQRIHAVRSKDILTDSKEYKRGCASAEIPDLPAGRYTIICSTFEPQQTGSFTLLAESRDAPVTLTLLPRENAGLLRQSLPPAIFRQGQTTLALPLQPKRLTNFHALARPQPPSHPRRSLVRLSLEQGTGFHRRVLCQSSEGSFADVTPGLRCPEAVLRPEMLGQGVLWLVLERMGGAGDGEREEGYAVEGFGDVGEGVGWGQWREWEGERGD